MEYFIITVVAFALGWKISEIFHVISFKKILEDLNVNGEDLKKLHNKIARDQGLAELYPSKNAAAESDGKTVVDIKVEELQGQLYAYEVDRDTFIAQGQTSDELLERILDRYPANHRIICDRSNGGDLITDAVERLAERNS